MKLRRARHFCFTTAIILSLFLSSIAAPLCACINATGAAHDCCAGMEDHCPMKGRGRNSLDKAPREKDCGCAVEKRQTTPVKILDKGNSQAAAPAATPGAPAFIFAVPAEKPAAFFSQKIFATQTFLNQTPARAPPCL